MSETVNNMSVDRVSRVDVRRILPRPHSASSREVVRRAVGAIHRVMEGSALRQLHARVPELRAMRAVWLQREEELSNSPARLVAVLDELGAMQIAVGSHRRPLFYVALRLGLIEGQGALGLGYLDLARELARLGVGTGAIVSVDGDHLTWAEKALLKISSASLKQAQIIEPLIGSGDVCIFRVLKLAKGEGLSDLEQALHPFLTSRVKSASKRGNPQPKL